MLGAIQSLVAQFAATPLPVSTAKQLRGGVSAKTTILYSLRARRTRAWTKKRRNHSKFVKVK